MSGKCALSMRVVGGSFTSGTGKMTASAEGEISAMERGLHALSVHVISALGEQADSLAEEIVVSEKGELSVLEWGPHALSVHISLSVGRASIRSWGR